MFSKSCAKLVSVFVNCVMAISCPLCCQSINFDLLRMNLINLRNRPLVCPICGDVQHSLDNLAVHLTQHHIELVPSQIGSSHCNAIQQCDANNGIQITTINSAAPICNGNLVEQFKVEPNSNGNMMQKFEVPSPLPPSPSPSSPPVSSLQNLNIASSAEPPPPPVPNIAARSNDQIGQPFVCNLCSGTFRSKELQQMHMQLVHEINIRPLPENNHNSFENGSAIPLAPDASAWQQCYWCSKRFKTIGSLRLHVRMVHGVLHAPQIICTPNATAFNCKTAMSNDNLMPLSSAAIAAGNDVKELAETGDPLIASTSTHDMNSNNLPLIHNNQTDYYGNYGLNDTTFGSVGSNNTNNNDGSGNISSNCDGMIDQKDTDEPYNGNNNNNNSKEMTTITGNSNSSSSTDDRIHKCDICNKRFTTKYFLKKHKRLHTGK